MKLGPSGIVQSTQPTSLSCITLPQLNTTANNQTYHTITVNIRTVTRLRDRIQRVLSNYRLVHHNRALCTATFNCIDKPQKLINPAIACSYNFLTNPNLDPASSDALVKHFTDNPLTMWVGPYWNLFRGLWIYKQNYNSPSDDGVFNSNPSTR